MEEGGLNPLPDQNRRKPNLKNWTDQLTEDAVCQHAIDCPAHGQVRAGNELRKQGIFVSASGIIGKSGVIENTLANQEWQGPGIFPLVYLGLRVPLLARKRHF